MKKTFFFLTAFLTAALFLPPALPLSAQTEVMEAESPAPRGIVSLEQFAKIPIMQEGRIKPMETYAQNILLRFSGRSSYEKKPAVVWLARLMFAPDTTRDDKIFLINHQDVPVALGILPDKKRRYSFHQLEKGFPKLMQMAGPIADMEAKQRSLAESEILRLAESLHLYAELSSSLLLAFPHPDFTIRQPVLRKQLDLPMAQPYFTCLDIATRAEKIYELTKDIEKKPAPEWTEKEKELVLLMTNLYQWSMSYRNLPFHIVPPSEEGVEEWLSPWDALAHSLHTEGGKERLGLIQEMMVAYWNGDQLAFDSAAIRFNQDVRVLSLAQQNPHALKSIPTELFYNQLKPFLWAKILYALTFFVFLLTFLSAKPFYRVVAWVIMAAGFFIHTLGLGLRIYILARPPVSTLYETFIFVAFVAVLSSFLIEKITRQWLGLVVGSLSGFIFLTIAGRFSTDGDTMQMLVAVLNSNFWLSTHVLSITTGYAGCSVAGLVGHIYLLEALLRPHDIPRLKKIDNVLVGALAFGLTMTFLGTNLGGIWADQSWGRFWGWDPKENGALLIVLWTAAIFHARMDRMIGPRGTAYCSVLGLLTVIWAWFGVNLLSVGLHSYGFTSGIAYGLIAYVIGEVIFLAVTDILWQRRQKAVK